MDQTTTSLPVMDAAESDPGLGWRLRFWFVVGDAPLQALLQATIPHHQQGRALSLMATVMGLAAPIGLAIVGPLGELLGTRWLFVVQGMLAGCVALSGFALRPLRQFGRRRRLVA